MRAELTLSDNWEICFDEPFESNFGGKAGSDYIVTEITKSHISVDVFKVTADSVLKPGLYLIPWHKVIWLYLPVPGTQANA
jgi:hypothetical protein